VPRALVLPGNHDIPLFNLAARLFAPYANHRRVFGDNLEPEFEANDMLVVTVNTTRRLRHENGVVSSRQIDRVARRLEHASREQVRVVVTHQPVAVTKPEDRKNLLVNHRAAIQAWAEAGADVVLGGHIHLPFVRSLHDAYAGCPRTTWAVQAGTAVSSRLRAGHPNSVNVLRVGEADDGRTCQAERWDHSAADKAFVCAKVLQLPLASAAAPA